jgi:hypothetical protein
MSPVDQNQGLKTPRILTSTNFANLTAMQDKHGSATPSA